MRVALQIVQQGRKIEMVNRLILIETARKMLPDNRWVKRTLTRARIQLLYRNLMPAYIVDKVLDTPSIMKEEVEKWEKRRPSIANKLHN